MSDNAALLRRIETDQKLADLLLWPGDFDIVRRDPIEDVFLESGTSLTPIAGDGAGGTYFLCGGVDGPVLYADSEGQATLMAADLTEAVTLIAVLPYWQDLGFGWSLEDSEAALLAEEPDAAEHRAELLALLAVTPPSHQVVADRMRAAASRTAPDFQPKARHDDGDGAYVATYGLLFGEA
ncbi:hypothetical protein [Actinomadura rupiterrae]|uniref:hypothetical protein n=1 Tax=Actinomadura rupiterrae TaxID=559627 RepID=UPI0020A4F6D1|nr:hypothetical protein [Actinomadura rupiterrae]MCP2340159.1 hypothetical protein [Actinomadura rupiterrae]